VYIYICVCACVCVLHLEYTERRRQNGILFIFSLCFESSNLEYVRAPVIYRGTQAEYGIHILLAASQEYVNTYSTRRVRVPVCTRASSAPWGLAFTRYSFALRLLYTNQSSLYCLPPLALPIIVLYYCTTCAIYDPPRPPLAYAIHHTILAMAISCKGQRGARLELLRPGGDWSAARV